MTNLELEERTTEENPEEDYIVVAERRYPTTHRPTIPGLESEEAQTEKILSLLRKKFGKNNVSIRPRLDENDQGTGFFQICVSEKVNRKKLERIQKEYKFPTDLGKY